MGIESAYRLPVAERWYETRAFGNGITLISESHVVPWMRCNMWHVQGRNRDLLIDSGMGLRPLKGEIAFLRQRTIVSVSTHCHFDHIGGAHEFKSRLGHRSEAEVHERPNLDNTCARAWIGGEILTALPHNGYRLEHYNITPAALTGYLDEGDIVDTGDRYFQVFHLPGHSPGSIALYEAASKTLFSGDVIYDGALIDNAWHSDPELYRVSLSRLKELPVETIHAGHEGSFDRARLVELIDSYLSGRLRLGDVATWLASKTANAPAESNLASE
jgi:glyoxylase-like metal-dependent hydrolase (beta-lactamase superfamily II)